MRPSAKHFSETTTLKKRMIQSILSYNTLQYIEADSLDK
jgi:hypothetical protein